MTRGTQEETQAILATPGARQADIPVSGHTVSIEKTPSLKYLLHQVLGPHPHGLGTPSAVWGHLGL